MAYMAQRPYSSTLGSLAHATVSMVFYGEDLEISNTGFTCLYSGIIIQCIFDDRFILAMEFKERAENVVPMANTKDVFKTHITRVLTIIISNTHSRGLALQKITSKSLLHLAPNALYFLPEIHDMRYIRQKSK
ncbi:hypothetical protein LXL04_036753 [Taraxacum kok-saghyz]